MTNKPSLGPADLLVDCAQGFVEGWTIQQVKDYAAACVAAERERCCCLVYGLCDSDNVAQRIVDAIRRN